MHTTDNNKHTQIHTHPHRDILRHYKTPHSKMTLIYFFMWKNNAVDPQKASIAGPKHLSTAPIHAHRVFEFHHRRAGDGRSGGDRTFPVSLYIRLWVSRVFIRGPRQPPHSQDVWTVIKAAGKGWCTVWERTWVWPQLDFTGIITGEVKVKPICIVGKKDGQQGSESERDR